MLFCSSKKKLLFALKKRGVGFIRDYLFDDVEFAMSHIAWPWINTTSIILARCTLGNLDRSYLKSILWFKACTIKEHPECLFYSILLVRNGSVISIRWPLSSSEIKRFYALWNIFDIDDIDKLPKLGWGYGQNKNERCKHNFKKISQKNISKILQCAWKIFNQ